MLWHTEINQSPFLSQPMSTCIKTVGVSIAGFTVL